uniref:Pectin acetylesterase n=1 Tax=Oryza meridionalis TaxID=40149 RepID=A0A0E0CBG7_9ORYZ
MAATSGKLRPPFRLLLLLLAAAVARSVDGVELTLLTGAREKGAVCLDGSPPGYHLQRGFGSGEHSWFIHLQGGAWCNTIEDCSRRKMSAYGSSKFMRAVEFNGILSNDQQLNSDFYNWNRVFIRYCDGASFSGDGEAQDQDGSTLHFRGLRIWEAVINELMGKGLATAKQAILSGCSAGGLAALLHCNDFYARFSKEVSAKCLPDAGFFLDIEDLSGERRMWSVFNGTVHLQNVTQVLSKDCLAKKDPTECFFPAELVKSITAPTLILNSAYDSWQNVREVLSKDCLTKKDPTECFFPAELVKSITAPTLILNSAYDSWQIQNAIAPDGSFPGQSWSSCKTDIRNCSSTQIQVFNGFRNKFVDNIEVVKDKKDWGLFIDSCFTHCQTPFDISWNSQASPVLGNKTVAEAIGDWYFERSYEVKEIDCEYPETDHPVHHPPRTCSVHTRAAATGEMPILPRRRYAEPLPLLLLAAVARSTAAAPDVVELILLTGAQEKGAVCLDGSPPGYHLQRGFGSGEHSWLIYLEGGAWCDTIESCSNRKTTELGSSKLMEAQEFEGILSNNQTVNSDFYNWNKVVIRYCDGASFSGNAEAQDQDGSTLHFRGLRIWQAVLDELMEKGLASAKQALLSGCSAGGLATLLHCNDFHARFPKEVSAKCLPDAGIFLDIEDLSGKRLMWSVFNGTVQLQNVSEVLPKDCLAKKDRTECFLATELVKSITAPTLIVNSAYDSWQIRDTLAPVGSYPGQSWLNCTNDIGNCNSTQMEVLNGFRKKFVDGVKVVKDRKDWGLFIDSCFMHCQTKYSISWSSQFSPVLGNKTIAKAVGDWYFERSKTVKEIDCEPYFQDALLVVWLHYCTALIFMHDFQRRFQLNAFLMLDFSLIEDLSGERHMWSVFNGTVNLQNVREVLSKDCLTKKDPTECFFPAELVKSITAPTLILNSAYDSWQMDPFLDSHGPVAKLTFGIAVPHKSKNKFVDDVEIVKDKKDWGLFIDSCFTHCQTPFNISWSSQASPVLGSKMDPFLDSHGPVAKLTFGIAVPHKSKNKFVDDVEIVKDKKDWGLFIDSCFTHCQTPFNISWSSQASPVLGSKTVAEAVGDWYFERSYEVKEIDCEYPILTPKKSTYVYMRATNEV